MLYLDVPHNDTVTVRRVGLPKLESVSIGPPPIAKGAHACWVPPEVSFTKIKYEPEGGVPGVLTWKLHPAVPSGPSLQETVVESTGVPVTEDAPIAAVPPVNPDPLTDTAVPPDPVLGERIILGTTKNGPPVAEAPLGYVVIFTVLHEAAVDPTATLNCAWTFPAVPP